MPSSRIPAFYQLSVEERQQRIVDALGLSEDEVATLVAADALPLDAADIMVENAVATFALPFGVGLNFQINGQDYIVPMVVEEPSVIAAASNAALVARAGRPWSRRVAWSRGAPRGRGGPRRAGTDPG